VVVSLCTFPLHIYWFGKWVRRQIFRISSESHKKTIRDYQLLRKIPLVERLFEKLPVDEDEIAIIPLNYIPNGIKQRKYHAQL
jgi:hypothetical protein